MLSCGCAYGDVVFCELVVEVVYADLTSVAGNKSAIIRLLKILYISYSSGARLAGALLSYASSSS